MKKVFHDFIVGVGHDPRVVAAVRAFVLYVLPLGAEALIGYLTHHFASPEMVGVIGVSAVVIRALEGAVIDYLKKPYQNDLPAAPAAVGINGK